MILLSLIKAVALGRPSGATLQIFRDLCFFSLFFLKSNLKWLRLVAPLGGSVGWLCLCLCIILYRRSGATEPKKSFRPCYSQKGWLRTKNTEPLKVAPFGQSGSAWPKRSQTEPLGATRSHLGATSEPPSKFSETCVFFAFFSEVGLGLVWPSRANLEPTWSHPRPVPPALGAPTPTHP